MLPPPLESAIGPDHPSTGAEDRQSASLEQAPTSPLRLAISAVLALVPLPSVVNPSRPSHIALRRKHAHQLVQRCLAMIEDETDIPDSPSTALAYGITTPQRQPLHPQVPIELESVLSLCLLAIYEYSQRGNIRKMQDRAGQALMSAMNMSLHTQIESDIPFAEARRRAWWMTVRFFQSLFSLQASSMLMLPPVHMLMSSFHSELYRELTLCPGPLERTLTICSLRLFCPTIPDLQHHIRKWPTIQRYVFESIFYRPR